MAAITTSGLPATPTASSPPPSTTWETRAVHVFSCKLSAMFFGACLGAGMGMVSGTFFIMPFLSNDPDVDEAQWARIMLRYPITVGISAAGGALSGALVGDGVVEAIRCRIWGKDTQSSPA